MYAAEDDCGQAECNISPVIQMIVLCESDLFCKG